ncbi:PRC-barrel domain-containing protein [Terrihabitans sp. B22-R8]|uniref:PRC-barrel domain-containing protein n=1 Tax=Terrihabitans sp. B22-R8 TaxID=3425128 RepID=UPI00403CD981
MMKRLLLSGAALSVTATLALAQTTAPAQNDPSTNPAPPHATSPSVTGAPAAMDAPANATVPADASAAQAQADDPNLYSNVQGADLVDSQDKSLGRIADILLDNTGQLRQVIIGHGGLLGVGETLRAYDASELPQVADGKVRLGEMTTASLEALPEFTYPKAETGRAATDATAPAGTNPPAGTVAPGGNVPGSTNDMAANTTETPPAGGMAPPSAAIVPSDALWPASELVGATITNAQDSAAINDLRFEGNKVAAALVDKGALGLGTDVSEVRFENLNIAGTPSDPEITLKAGTSNVPVEAPAAP